MELFGFEIRRRPEKESIKSFAPEVKDDNAVVVAAGGTYGTYVDLDGTVRTEAELVSKYREMSLQPEIDKAINEIVNESIVVEDGKKTVELILDDLNVDNKIKDIMQVEFDEILDLLNFKNGSYDIFKKWYIDGRSYYHVVIDEKSPVEGIKELRFIDPRKIRKIREVSKKRDASTQAVIQKTKNEYYLYSERGLNYGSKVLSNVSATGVRISSDAIIHVTSGLSDINNTMGLSYLHPAIKPLNQLRALEDATIIYHLSRSPERRIFYIDVGNLPKMKAEQYLRDMMVKYKNRLVYDAATGEIRDDRKFMCYALDTKIPLLDGRTITLQDLIYEHEIGKKNWVYSCDPITGKFVPGPVSWAGITKNNAKVVKVTFDNGKSVVCTPDHKFPVWGEGLVEAQHLIGKSIIPGYRRNKKINSNGNEYEQIYQNETKTWEFTHRLVSKWKDENNITDALLFKSNEINETNKVVHHNDFNRFNNNPENLFIMDYDDHILYHSSIASERNKQKWITDSNYRNKMKDIQTVVYPQTMLDFVNQYQNTELTYNELLKILNNNNYEFIEANKNKKIKNKPIGKVTYGDLIRIIKLLGFTGWNDFKNGLIIDGKKYASYSQAVKNLGVTYVKHSINNELSYHGSEDWKKKLSIAKKGKYYTSKTWKVFKPNGEIEIIENLNGYAKLHGLSASNMKNTSSKGYKAEELVNHKAVSVEWLTDAMDVGCITVDLNETYHSHHTYLLDAGVYTKNTMLEDFWLPRREGGKGTEIQTLAGGTALPDLLGSVEYFQDRLYRALQVPLTRLKPDNVYVLGRATEISRDEVNFSKFIDRIRNKFSELFMFALEKQLILKKIATPDDWDQIKKFIKFRYLRDNYFTELKDMEIQSERMQRLREVMDSAVGRYYSNLWVRKNILRQTDEDIEENDQQIAQEFGMPQYHPEMLQMEYQNNMQQENAAIEAKQNKKGNK